MRLPKRVIIYGIVSIHVLLILLFFDTKVHIGGDDSDYIVASLDFLEGKAFPTWHGSFYPIFLSPFIAVAGVNLILLKCISAILTLLSSFILYQAFNKRVADVAIIFSLAINCFSQVIVQYGSTTYSEPLFMFFQSLVIFFLVKLEDTTAELKPYTHRIFRNEYFLCLVLGLVAFLLSSTRNVGLGAFITLIIYFTSIKKWKYLFLFSGAYVFLQTVFILYKKFFWNIVQVGSEGQFSRIAYKNFYNPADGKEDAIGFIIRFWENSQLYLSKHLAVLMGIRPATSVTTSAFLTLVFYALFLLACVIYYKKNRILFFILLYLAVLLGATFVTQQTHWDQVRLVLVYLFLISLVLGSVLHTLITSKETILSYAGKTIVVMLPLLVLFRTLSTPTNFTTSLANLTSDPFRGYADEWKNYALVSEWAGEHIDNTKNILCRKPGISTVYGKRTFQGLSRFTHTVPDSADQLLIRRNIDYVVLDNLSMPTVARLLAYYLRKHPLGLKLIHTQGFSKPSYILAIDRKPPIDDVDYLNRVHAGLLIYSDIPYFYLLAADRYFSRQEYTKASTYYTSALQFPLTDPEKNAVYRKRAWVYFQQQDFAKARKDIDIVLAQNPHDKEAQQLAQHATSLLNEKQRLK